MAPDRSAGGHPANRPTSWGGCCWRPAPGRHARFGVAALPPGGRPLVETARVPAETARVPVETARVPVETARVPVETARVPAKTPSPSAAPLLGSDGPRGGATAQTCTHRRRSRPNRAKTPADPPRGRRSGCIPPLVRTETAPRGARARRPLATCLEAPMRHLHHVMDLD